MLNDMVVNNLNIMPENPFAVRQEGVITNAIHSQAFLFGEFNMNKFKRKLNTKEFNKICYYGCGQKAFYYFKTPNKWCCENHYKKCPASIAKVSGENHHNYGKKFPQMSGDNNPMRRPEIVAKMSGKNHPMKKPENAAKFAGKNNPNWKEKIIVNCAYCGKLKKILPSRNHKGNHFCSNNGECYGKWRSINKIGEKSYCWKGGISCEPYCREWNFDEFKQIIRDRDNNECQNPDCWKNCNLKHKLCIHHIDGNKKNCKPWNLISVCKSCNSRAEGNKLIPRIWWQELYQNIIIEKYNTTL